MITNLKERMIGATGSISGAASILGSWQVCHNICLGLVAALSMVGITLTGMPLMFFTKIALPLWSAALVLLGIAAYFSLKKQCISKALLVVNSGFIIAGIPLQSLQQFQALFWTIGGALVLAGAGVYLKDRIVGVKV